MNLKSGAKPLNKQNAIDFLYAVENPTYKNVNQTTGYATMYNDGTKTIGPGVAITSGANKKWFEEGTLVKKEDVDNEAYRHLSQDDIIIRRAYDKRYGTSKMLHPSDTLSEGPRLFVSQARYQRGSLGDKTNAILEALALGNQTKLVKAVEAAVPPGDNDRKRRLSIAMPRIYKSNPVVPSVNKKR